MILSSQSTFGERFSIGLPANTTVHSTFLPNEIDLGEPMIPVHGKKAMGRSIGGGTPIPVFFAINEITNNARVKVWFNIWTSDDNVTFKRLFQYAMNPNVTSNQIKSGDVASSRILVLGVERYVRVVAEWQGIVAPPANTKLIVTSSLGTVSGTSSDVFK